jgi:hypothetical protein
MDTYINCCNCNWVGMANGPYCPSCGHNCYPGDDTSLIGSNDTAIPPTEDEDTEFSEAK